MCLCNPNLRCMWCDNCKDEVLHKQAEKTYEDVWEKYTGLRLRRGYIVTGGGELWFDSGDKVLEIGGENEQICYSKTIKSPEHLDKVLCVLLD